MRVIGEVLEGAGKPVGSDAQGVVQLRDQRRSDTKVIELPLKNAGGAASDAHPQHGCGPSIQRVLDAIVGAPAWVHNDRLDFLAANRLGYPLYSEMFADPARPVNSARFMFLNPRSHDFHVDWERVADNTVAILRGAAGRNPYDKAPSNLVGELSTRSEDFRTRWAAHDVRLHGTGVKKLHHPIVGDLDLTYEGMELLADPGLMMLVYTAEPGTGSEDGLKLLASWAATQELTESVPEAVADISRAGSASHLSPELPPKVS